MKSAGTGKLSTDTTISRRINTLKLRMQNTHSERMSGQRKEIYRREFAKHSEVSQVFRMAKGLASFLREKDIILWEDDLFAGYEQFYDFSVPAVPPACEKTEGEGAGAKGGNNACGENSTDARSTNSSEAEFLVKTALGGRIGLFGGGLGGHVIAGYRRVLEKGFGALAEEAEAKLQTGDPATKDFAAASLTVCKAAADYALRYAEKAEELAGNSKAAGGDGAARNRKQLRRIGEACRWIAINPARTFYEAVQLLWLTHEIITCEQSSGSLSLGRIDQYLHPFYEKDLANGVLTPCEAAELIQALWIKFSGIRRGFQHVVLGGGRNGSYEANALSSICLQATSLLRLDQPLLSVRWRRDMPDDFWTEIQELIRLGMGFPALFNDEVAIEAKRRLGVAVPDAEDYGIVGCVELSIPGKEFSHTEELRVNWAKVLELMLNGGVCTVTGERMALREQRDLESFASFREFFDWYKIELSHFLELGIKGRNIADRHFPENRPYPFLSSTMERCLENGKDVTAGSTVYNFSTVNACGMANAANSLAAVKRLVFDEKRMTLPALARVLAESDIMPRELISACRSVGNDQPEPDEILKEIADCFCRAVLKNENPRGGRFQAGLYTVDAHTYMGLLTGTLPDGRRRCTALASGMSPSQGTDLSGPTAVIKSISKLDHRILGNGMVLDLKFHPSFFEDTAKRKAFRQLVETYFNLGGMEIQFNVIDRETLRRAQSSPEAHRDLIVRVSGFSAYFVDLVKETQDEIIARTEHATIGK